MIARINAMYERSKKVFIFLVAALLACTIASAVIMVIANLGVSAREFQSLMKVWSTRDSWTFARASRPFRLRYMHDQYRHVHDASDLRECDTHHYMGDPRFISHNLGYYKVLS